VKNHDEAIGSQVTHVILPLIVVLITVGVSLSVDLCAANDLFLFQRSGALMAALSIYIAYHENRQRYLVNNGTLNIQTKIWYQWVALVLGLIGTAIWAYGDIPFK